MGGILAQKRNKNGTRKDFVSWFEIPAIDFQQAVNFYNYIFNIEMEQVVNEDSATAFFPVTTGIGGAITSGFNNETSASGPLLYLNGGDDLNLVLNKVEDAGGRIIMSKTLISKNAGYFAVFIDSQGNKLALYSKK
ncbi:MAG: VOC family protein [Candidatus Kapaibacterium sp.]